MKTVVAYESMYGNTRQVAEAIAEGLGNAEILAVNDGDAGAADDADLVVAGGPTHMHGLATTMSRKGTGQAAEEEGTELEPGAVDGPGLRKWLADRNGGGMRAAAFDTRIDKSPMLTGAASRGIAKRLRKAGFEVIADPESFFVEDSEGPLADGELERAKAWGAELAKTLG